MPNIKSAEKRVKIADRQRTANMAKRSALRSFIKKAFSSITAGKSDQAKSDLMNAVRQIDMAVTKGIIHKNQAARRKSRLTKKLNALNK